MLLRDAPEFSLAAYLVYASEGRADFLDQALQGIREIATFEAVSTPRSTDDRKPKASRTKRPPAMSKPL